MSLRERSSESKRENISLSWKLRKRMSLEITDSNNKKPECEHVSDLAGEPSEKKTKRELYTSSNSTIRKTIRKSKQKLLIEKTKRSKLDYNNGQSKLTTKTNNKNTIGITDTHTKMELRRVDNMKVANDVLYEDSENNIPHISSNSQNTKTDFMCNFKDRKSVYQFQSSGHSIIEKSINIFHFLYKSHCGMQVASRLKKSINQPVIRLLSDFELCRCASPFSSKTTAMEWHPTNPNKLAAGSKHGDIILWDSSTINNDKIVHGLGPGGSIQAMKFWPWDSSYLVTASINGTVTLNDLEGRHSPVLSDTENCMNFWYCSLDVSKSHKVVITGDNTGNTLCLSENGEKIWNYRLHKQKVRHVEFSPRESWLFCTASVDHTVKLWDIRMVKNAKSALCKLQHDKGVNCAYFSSTDGSRLLTTDQHSEIKIFSAPEWRLQRSILHPHRFFQHITPIKAAWHPLQDLIVVGRYPDPSMTGLYKHGERRTIDIIDADTGEIMTQLFDPSAPGIVSLNKFNHSGESLASGMGVNILLWNRKDVVVRKQEKLKNKMIASGLKITDLNYKVPSNRNSALRNNNTKTDSIKYKVNNKLKK